MVICFCLIYEQLCHVDSMNKKDMLLHLRWYEFILLGLYYQHFGSYCGLHKQVIVFFAIYRTLYPVYRICLTWKPMFNGAVTGISE